jgi:sigma-B regulation protein RsbU (phosphoserine phosphatase)
MPIARNEMTMGTLARTHSETLTSLTSRSLLRREVAAGGPKWLPATLILGSIAAVAYADFIVSSVSLGYLYILPLGISAMFLRPGISYALIAVCIFLHDFFGPLYPSPGARILHNLTAAAGFIFVVYVIQRYVKQREQLARTVRQQRDQLLQDVELAAQVQRMFLPSHRPAIPGLEIAGMMQPARGVSGDYFDYMPVNDHTLQLVIADVAGKGVPAALLMAATAAAVQLETREKRDMLEVVNRLNASLYSLSGSNRYVTLLLADIDTRKQSLSYVNCGHNPALLYRTESHAVVTMNSSCVPIGMFDSLSCAMNPVTLAAGDVLVLYTDGVIEAEDSQGEEFGMERLSSLIQRDHMLSSDELINHILESITDFSRNVGFEDDVTILVVKFKFDSM